MKLLECENPECDHDATCRMSCPICGSGGKLCSECRENFVEYGHQHPDYGVVCTSCGAIMRSVFIRFIPLGELS